LRMVYMMNLEQNREHLCIHLVVLKEKLPLEKRGGLEYIDLRFEKVYLKRSEDPSEE